MTRIELEYTLSLRHSHFTLGRETIAKLLTHDADQRQVIEQLEGRVKALEGALEKVLALKNILERAYRGYGTPEEERQKAALAATGEDQHGGNN